MRHYIHKLRQKSDRIKTALAFGGAGTITLGIISLWIFALPGGKPLEIIKVEEQPASIFQTIFGKNKDKEIVTPETSPVPFVSGVTESPNTNTPLIPPPIQQGASIYESAEDGIIVPEPESNTFIGEQVFIEKETTSPTGSTMITNETDYSVGGM